MSDNSSPKSLVSEAYDRGYNQGWFMVPWSPTDDKAKEDRLCAHRQGYNAGMLDRQIYEAR